MVAKVDLDINLEGSCKSHNLHVISICAALCHPLQMCFVRSVDLSLSRARLRLIGICSRILALRVTTLPTAWVDIHERLEVGSILAQVLNHFCSQVLVLALVAVELVRQSIEKTVPYLSIRMLYNVMKSLRPTITLNVGSV